MADVSNVAFLARFLSAACIERGLGDDADTYFEPSGTVYSVGIKGTGNTALSPCLGQPFLTANFTPTYIAANPLQGETYIASSSGQVDVLTRPTTQQGGLTLTLTGSRPWLHVAGVPGHAAGPVAGLRRLARRRQN